MVPRMYTDTPEYKFLAEGIEELPGEIASAWEFGFLMRYVKHHMPHGQWLPYLKKHGYGAKMVSNKMRISVHPATNYADCASIREAINIAYKRDRRAPSRRYMLLLAKRDGWDCQICHNELDFQSKGTVEVDHQVPLWNGGSNDLANLRLVCTTCNRSRNSDDHLQTTHELDRAST